MFVYLTDVWKHSKMPANSNSINRYLCLVSVLFCLNSQLTAQIPQLEESQRQWLGERIFQNECNAHFDCLTSWNEGEEFPSLGIGHFIWFQANQEQPFTETFPALLASYKNLGYSLPTWLTDLSDPDSPWTSREQFLQEINSDKMVELRTFLANTKSVQVDFISQRLYDSLSVILAHSSGNSTAALEETFLQIAHSHPPYGLYALIDYVHFKGTGTNSAERYKNSGWGLLQVLQEMSNRPTTLWSFVQAAETVLERRVENAPLVRNEQRWLLGWKNRLQTYLPTLATLPINN
ncbi:MAG TPA: hypothetical protein EYG31_01180 [Porticoccaceae bacterium]|jgi:hypothetical protein|nr:hypothetical protein [Gammaproteobacteria bacterium]HIL59235.1 hypothetical protein [Porticoccaceae bacterium]